MYKVFLHNNFLRLILIESQWNLNQHCACLQLESVLILIESQWNLNVESLTVFTPLPNINRITVEFKSAHPHLQLS